MLSIVFIDFKVFNGFNTLSIVLDSNTTLLSFINLLFIKYISMKLMMRIIPKIWVFLIVLYNKYVTIDINIEMINNDLFKSSWIISLTTVIVEESKFIALIVINLTNSITSPIDEVIAIKYLTCS